jgi:TetR/AcrR family transcriptional repressor of nem operon
MLVNTALDIAPHDEAIGRLVSGYIGEIRAFFSRCLEAAQRSGALSSKLDVDVVSAHLMGIVMGLRVLARTRATPAAAKRKLLDAVARPALDLLVSPRKSAAAGGRR